MAVTQYMVKGPNQTVIGITEAEQREAKERRLCNLYPTLPIKPEEILNACVLFFIGTITPVLLFKRKPHGLVDLLNRLFETLPANARSEDRVSFDHPLPCSLESCSIQFFVQGINYLPEINFGHRSI